MLLAITATFLSISLFAKTDFFQEGIELFMKNDYPLIIKYTVASLGEIKLCLAPKCNAE